MVVSKSYVECPKENLREVFGIENQMIMYVGNLEFYQGIDLLLEAFSYLVREQKVSASLVIIGGDQESIFKYSQLASRLGIDDSVYLIGTRPLKTLSSYLSQADILVSPRLKGINTPMKLFSYLHSGKPTLVTNLITHTQVVEHNTAYLVEPNPESVSQGLITLLNDQKLREQLGSAGKHLIETSYSRDAFAQKFDRAISWLERELKHNHQNQRGLEI